ncbi:MAG: hypothetical protein GC180_12570 [Bacteroidetes bacterium]|nr:hypothetical protein [Bacteroidota bacterium]
MKSILSLGLVFLLLVGAQIVLEQRSTVTPEGTDTELDSINTRYKFENGKLYFLGDDGHWNNRVNFVWKGNNGHYFLQENGQIYQSNDGTFWSLLSLDQIHQDILPLQPVSNKQ